ncbi:hypothetical protein [Devosia sp. FKR38]|uniref:hypothetical protein n=1 Tax=Devosia sp. FKR38 TaxID=2562312 RepID=UPI0010BFA992|nr:hypothetical protein [Devosia sp. FKR38]
MALSLPGERSIVAATPRPFAALLRWLGQAKAARARRNALESLLDLDHSRLDDLGISRADISAALARRDNNPGHVLNAARARNARL